MNMKSIIFILAIALVSATAQEKRPPRELPRVPNGPVTLNLHPHEYVVSLQQLVEMSKLIVDGTVLYNMPVVNVSANADRPELETHSVVSVSSVIAGQLPAGSLTILLAQPGGKDDKWDVKVPADPVVKSGERYILFLIPDNRKEPPNQSRIGRYVAVGMWAGKAKVENERVRLLSAVSSAPKLYAYSNTVLGDFVEAVRGIVNHTIIPEKRNAIPHPGLPERK